MKKIIILIVIISLVSIGCGVFLLYEGVADYKVAADEYENIGRMYVTDTKKTQQNQEISAESNMEVSSEQSTSDVPLSINFSELEKINSDIVGWIYIADTKVNYPIVKGQDNEKYLNTTFEGKKSGSGAIFMDTDNSTDFSDANTLIYGHNMKDGSMFKTVNKYDTEEFYKEHSSVWIFTKDEAREYQVLSAHPAKSISSTYQINFGNKEEYKQHITSEILMSLYDTRNKPNYDKGIVTLTTCRGRNYDQRFVLVLQCVRKVFY